MADNTNSVLNVWVEGQITEDGLNLALLSEESGDGARVEAVEHISADDLQSRDGELFTLSLSDSTAENLSNSGEGQVPLSYTSLLEKEGEQWPEACEPSYPQAGEIVYDENAPKWSNDTRVKVVEVLSDVTCDEYVIQGTHANSALDPSLQSWNDETVADANPGYSDDEPVIIGEYVDGDSTEYAFPVSRLQRSP